MLASTIGKWVATEAAVAAATLVVVPLLKKAEERWDWDPNVRRWVVKATGVVTTAAVGKGLGRVGAPATTVAAATPTVPRVDPLSLAIDMHKRSL